jgi:hypothetical protein
MLKRMPVWFWFVICVSIIPITCDILVDGENLPNDAKLSRY